MDEMTTPARTRVAATMADEAGRLIDSFDDAQRAVAVWPFPSDDERRRGSTHPPTTAVSRWRG